MIKRLVLIGILSLVFSPLHAADFAVQDANLNACLQAIAVSKQWTQPQDFTQIKCHSEGIQSLKGLELFTNVETLSLYNNQLKRLDVEWASLPKLKTLNLARNSLEQVSMADLSSVENLYLFSNRLKSLKLTNLSNLAVLKTNNNEIESFHYSTMPRLKKIYIFNNQLESIDIYDLPALQYMDCRENPMPDELYDEMDRMEEVTFLHDGNAEDW